MTIAIYSRFSTDRQNESSITDQVRVCTEYAQRQGWHVFEHYSDAGISGAAMGNRPGFLRMRRDAMANRFSVLLVTDTTRLARSQELAPLIERLRFQGVRVIGVQDSFDSANGAADMQAGMSGIMSVEFRRMVKARTHAALETRAKNQKPTGGKAYGYIASRDSQSGVIEIDAGQLRKAWPDGREKPPVLANGPDQAMVVRRIFEMFAAGIGARAIAARLNADGILSPGSTWKRTTRRGNGWMGSGIRAMLLNERYHGVVNWNTSEWRKDPDTGKRQRVGLPKAKWITHTDESQRIVPEDAWRRASQRLTRKAARVQERMGEGMSRDAAKSTGRGPKFLLSGLLKCQTCGAAYVIAGVDRYACSGHVNGGDALCANNATMRREVAEHEVVAGIKRGMSDPAVIAEIAHRLRRHVRKPKVAAPDNTVQIATLKATIENLADAVATGGLRTSSTLAARLTAAEDELAQLQAVEAGPAVAMLNVEQLLADLPKRAARAVQQLEKTLAAGDIPRSREEIRDHVGMVSVDADEREIRLWGDRQEFAAVLLRATGTHTSNCGSGGRI